MEKRIAEINEEIGKLSYPIHLLELEKHKLERQIAIEKGKVAVNLSDLRTTGGHLFEKMSNEKIKGVDDSRYFRYAQASIPIARAVIPSSEKSERSTPEETMAYHCHFCGLWVEGKPNESRYDSIGILTGSRGTSFYCSFCGGWLGEYATMHA